MRQESSAAAEVPKAREAPEERPFLARCALKPGVVGHDQCDKAADGYVIRGTHLSPSPAPWQCSGSKELFCLFCKASQCLAGRAPHVLTTSYGAEGQRYLKVMCTEGCVMSYHFACWRRFERVHRAEHPEFNWKVTSCCHETAAAHCMSDSPCAVLDFLLALLAQGGGLACLEDYPITLAGMVR